MDMAYNDGNVTIVEAELKAHETLFAFVKEQEVLSQAKSVFTLDADGVLAYIMSISYMHRLHFWMLLLVSLRESHARTSSRSFNRTLAPQEHGKHGEMQYTQRTWTNIVLLTAAHFIDPLGLRHTPT